MSLPEVLISLLTPHHCISCGEEGALLCSACAYVELSTVPKRCFHCKRSQNNSRTCSRCSRGGVASVWVCTEYDHTAKALLHAYKFEHARSAHKTIAHLMRENLPIMPEDIIIVPLPSVPSRTRVRGYDHTVLLAKELAKQLRAPMLSLLARLGDVRQVGSSRAQRIRQMKNVFYAKKPYVISGAHILLVDDIVTTGASLESAARTLRAAGAKQVDAVVFAQTL